MSANPTQLLALLQRQDESFLARFSDEHDPPVLAAVTDAWLADPHPWAQSQLERYIGIAFALTGHEVVFKRILRHAEATGNHNLMGCLLVELDRCVRRRRVTWRVEQDGEFVAQEVLRACPNRRRILEHNRPRAVRHPATGKIVRWMEAPRPPAPGDRLFTQTTRAWLRRCVWRHFRKLSRSDPASYLASIGKSLARYTDDDAADSDQAIDNRGLMHIAFFHSAALTIGPRHVDIDEGVSAFDLLPAPWSPELWNSSTGYATLLEIVTTAGSRFVREWALEILESEHEQRLASLDPSVLIELLGSDDSVIREFAAHTLESHSDLAQFSLDDVVKLVTDPNPAVSAVGFQELRRRHDQSPVAADIPVGLADNACLDTCDETTRWSLNVLTKTSAAAAGAGHIVHHNECLRFFESPVRTIRDAAFHWLAAVCCEFAPKDWPLDVSVWSFLARSSVPGVATRAVRILRTHWSETSLDKFADVPMTLLSSEFCGVRNRAWAMHELANRTEQSCGLSSKEIQSVLADALRSSSSELRRAALVVSAKLAMTTADLRELAMS